MLFGHGAATPMRAPLMNQMAHALAARGVATFRYNYPYSHRLETGYTGRPHRPAPRSFCTTTRAAAKRGPTDSRPICPYSSAAAP